MSQPPGCWLAWSRTQNDTLKGLIAESYDYSETATNQAIQDGITAGVIGGLAGAAIGSFSGHAGSGAGIGALVGVGTQAIGSATAQHEDATRVWANCMASRGYAIYSVR